MRKIPSLSNPMTMDFNIMVLVEYGNMGHYHYNESGVWPGIKKPADLGVVTKIKDATVTESWDWGAEAI